MANSLPTGWIELSFTELLDIQGGTQPPKSTFIYAPKKDYIRLLQIRDFGEKPHPTYIPFRIQLKTCKPDDILIARYGASLGRIVTGMQGAYNVALAKVIIPEEINRRYVLYLLKSEIFQRPILANERSAQDGFNKDDLERIAIPMPPLSEQQRIVEKLDSLMDRIGNCKTLLRKIKSLENKLFLSYIFNGGELYRGRPLADFCYEENDRIGNKWNKRRLIGVSKDEGIVNLRTGGKKSFENYKIVKPGDFIYNPMRVDIGSIAIWSGTEEAITSPDYVVFRVNELISPQLLLRFLKSSYGLAEINNNTQGSVRSRLYYRNLISINYPYSTGERQAEAEKLFKFFSKTRVKYELVAKYLDDLESSILAKAFRGELVSQNENDEPASELLKRIQQGKHTISKPPKTTSRKTQVKKKKVYELNDDEELRMVAEG